MTSGMHSSWAPHTAPPESPSLSGSAFYYNRLAGPEETGGRVALPVFKEILLRVYREKLFGPVPEFPAQMEQSINVYLKGDSLVGHDLLRLGKSAIRPFDPWPDSPLESSKW